MSKQIEWFVNGEKGERVAALVSTDAGKNGMASLSTENRLVAMVK